MKRHLGIWRLAVFGEQAATARLMTWLFLGIGVLGGVLGALFKDADRLHGACSGAGFMLLLVALTWWPYFMSGAATQNSPANGALVPRLNRSIRETALLAWLVSMVLVLPFAYSVRLGALELLLLVLAVSSVGIAQAGRPADFGATLVAAAVYVLADAYPEARAWLSSTPVLALLAAVIGAYVWRALWAALPAGGEGHWKQLGKHRSVLAWQNMKSWEESGRRGGNRYRAYSWLLRRQCRSGRGGEALLLHGLGPRNNYLYTVLPVLALILMVIATKVALEAFATAPGTLPQKGILGWLVGAVGFAFSWQRFSSSIRNTATEQTLLRLSPGMPAASALNAALARRMAMVCLAEWLVWALASALLVAVWSGDRASFQAIAAMSAAMLLLTGMPFEDYANKPEGVGGDIVLLIVWVGGLLIAALIMHDQPLEWAVLVGLLFLTSVVFIAARWRNMLNSPVPFPAGRMA